MKSNKKSILSGSLLAGTIMSVSALGANTAPLNTYSSLGSASEVRAELLSNNVSDTKTKGSNKSEEKAKDAKCGEGKCGPKDGKQKPADEPTPKKK